MYFYPPALWSLFNSCASAKSSCCIPLSSSDLLSHVFVWRLVCVCRLGWTVHRVTAAVQRWKVCGCAVTSTLNASPWRDRERDCLPWSVSQPPRRRERDTPCCDVIYENSCVAACLVILRLCSLCYFEHSILVGLHHRSAKLNYYFV